MKRFSLFLLLIVALVMQACSTATPTPAKASKPAPAIDLPLSQNNTNLTLSGAAINVEVPTNCTPANNFINTANAGAFMEQVIQLTNAERTKVNASTLSMNNNLRNAAQAHTIDMACRQYFSHTAPAPAPFGASPFDRITAFGYAYSAAAENIAAGQTSPAEVVTSWMNSEGHRTNMLNPTYTQIGIGYVFYANDTLQTNYFHYWVMTLGKPQ